MASRVSTLVATARATRAERAKAHQPHSLAPLRLLTPPHTPADVPSTPAPTPAIEGAAPEPVTAPRPPARAAPRRGSPDAVPNFPWPLPGIYVQLSRFKNIGTAWYRQHPQTVAVAGVVVLAGLIVVPFAGDDIGPSPPVEDAPVVVGSASSDRGAESMANLSGVARPELQLASSGSAKSIAGATEHDNGQLSEVALVDSNDPVLSVIPSAASTNTDKAVYELPQLAEGDLSISGRIVTQTGEPVPNFGATARFLGRGASGVYTGSSDRDGVYEITGLAPGEYRVQTVATDRYPPVTIIARAGLQSAGILLIESHAREVFGTVTDMAGKVLAGVNVVSNAPNKPARTDDAGNYALSLNAQSNRSYTLRYELAGYQREQISVSGTELVEGGKKRVDAKLVTVGDTTIVTGLVQSEFGEPVAGARIYLHSRTTIPYQEVSDGQGGFSITDVKVGADYRLTVKSAGAYER